MKGCLLVILLALGAFWYFGTGGQDEEKYPASVLAHPEMAKLIKDADHVGVYSADGETDLRGFVSSMLAYQPWWLDYLYKIRALLVRLLGMKQGQVPTHINIPPQDIPLTKGAKVSIFTVVAGKEGAFWLVQASDKHLEAHMGVVVEPSKSTKKKFHLVVVVHYKNWAGPVYFNIIRPFEWIVVRGMVRQGALGSLSL